MKRFGGIVEIFEFSFEFSLFLYGMLKLIQGKYRYHLDMAHENPLEFDN